MLEAFVKASKSAAPLDMSNIVKKASLIQSNSNLDNKELLEDLGI
jgi:hypothetical protein